MKSMLAASRTLAVAILATGALLPGCGRSPSSESLLKDEFSGHEFWAPDAADRQDVVEEIFHAIGVNYAALGVKKARLGIDLETQRLEALLAEQRAGTANPDDPVAEARSNLDFYDRLKLAIAAFQDTHFWIDTVNPLPFLDNGLRVAEIDGSMRIVTLYSELMRYDDILDGTTRHTALALGDEVVAIDGKSVDTLVGELTPYIGASSPDFARSQAVRALTSRGFRMPTTAASQYTIRHADGSTETIAIPWYVDYDGNRRPDAERYLASIGLGEASTYPAVQEALAAHDGVPTDAVSLFASTGYRRRQPLKGVALPTVWYKEGAGDRVLSLGSIERDGTTYAVLQILAFNAPILESLDGRTKRPFTDVVGEFVAQAKADHRPLILDLRSNGGGNPMRVTELMSHLLPPGGAIPTTTTSYRITPLIRSIIETYDETSFDLEHYDFDQAAIHFVKKAVSARRPFTAVFADAPTVTPSTVVGGFTEPVVALVTPDCISACDEAAMLLEATGTIPLIGTHANGTGAGSRGTELFKSDPWRDDRQLVQMGVPNELFGRPGAIGEYVFEDEGAMLRLNSENLPVSASIQYAETLPDFLDSGSGWVDQAIATIQRLRSPESSR
jgi:C-terminal processing protease CtpA/Prc